jgi:hypothetical protein
LTPSCPDTPPALAPIDAFWAGRLGCGADDLRRPGRVVLPDEALPYRRVELFQRGRSSVVRAHPYRFADVARALAEAPPGEGARQLAARFMGASALPADELYYLLGAPPAPVAGAEVRPLTPDDADAVDGLSRACTRRDRDRAEVWPSDPVLFGAFQGGRLASAASLRFWGDVLADVGVLTRPECRGRGLARAAVAALCRWGADHGRIVQYATAAENVASRRVARSLGFALYAVEEAVWVA